jgi:hypothetical protein
MLKYCRVLDGIGNVENNSERYGRIFSSETVRQEQFQKKRIGRTPI